MELRHIKYFLTVAEELNFSRAAEKLFISQPPLSRQIKELEEELGARLFDRNNKKVELTEAGKYFVEEAKAIFSKLGEATQRVKKIAENVSGEFKLGYISSTYSSVITELVHYISEKYPFAVFKLYEVPSSKQITALENGKLDLGILRAPVVSSKLETEVWFRDHFSIVFSKETYDIHAEEHISMLRDAPFIFFNRDYAPDYSLTLFEICAGYGFTPNVVHESNNIQSILQLVESGLGVSIVPSGVLKNYTGEQLGSYSISNERFYSEVLLTTKRGSDSEVVRAMREFLMNAVSR